MNYLIVTGVSSGIGKAIVVKGLEKDYKVIGLGRKSDIKNKNFKFVPMDLNDLSTIDLLELPNISPTDTISLINNAGILGEINLLEKTNNQQTTEVINVNLLAPMLLAKLFLKNYNEHTGKKVIINISSGASTSAYPSWTAYCSSKAGLEMMTKCLIEEQKDQLNTTHIYAIAPGVVDTNMQVQIRNTKESEFKFLNKFQKLYDENMLFSPEYVARKLLEVIENPEKFQENIFRIN